MIIFRDLIEFQMTLQNLKDKVLNHIIHMEECISDLGKSLKYQNEI